MLKQRELT